MKKLTIIICATSSALVLTGCGSLWSKKDKTQDVVQHMAVGAMAGGGAMFRGVDLAQRALPTHGQTAKTNAHVDHVYVDPGSPMAKSLETIGLEDAVANDVLISGDFEPVDLAAAHVRGDGAKLVRIPLGHAQRPSAKESVAGEGMDMGIEAAVNFDLGSSVMINPERLSPIVERAAVIAGDFVVLGYTDSLGTEPFNERLAQDRADSVARELVAAGVNATRIKSVGVGVSNKYPDHASNRHATVLFYVEE